MGQVVCNQEHNRVREVGGGSYLIQGKVMLNAVLWRKKTHGTLAYHTNAPVEHSVGQI